MARRSTEARICCPSNSTASLSRAFAKRNLMDEVAIRSAAAAATAAAAAAAGQR